MTYRRVIPRDLFNEASLLKCLGQLYLKTERHHRHVRLVHTGNEFPIFQDASSGAIRSGSVFLIRQ